VRQIERAHIWWRLVAVTDAEGAHARGLPRNVRLAR
jgi:hypothetical protein